MVKLLRKSGVDVIGDISGDTHICLFYRTGREIEEIMVPYFRAGLENNEFCLWITSSPFDQPAATKASTKSVPGFYQHLERGQMEIIPHTAWYFTNGKLRLYHAGKLLTARLSKAMSAGYDGMRLATNTGWLGKEELKDWIRWLEDGEEIIGDSRLVSLGAYSMKTCDASAILEVASYHQMSLIKRNAKWDVIERCERNRMKNALDKRVRELRCLYDVANITGSGSVSDD